MKKKKLLYLIAMIPLLNSCVLYTNNLSDYSHDFRKVKQTPILLNGTFHCKPKKTDTPWANEFLDYFIVPEENHYSQHCKSLTMVQHNSSSIKLICRDDHNQTRISMLKENKDYFYKDGWYHIIYPKKTVYHSNFANGSLGNRNISFTLDKFNHLILKSDTTSVVFVTILPIFNLNMKVLKYTHITQKKNML